MVISDRTIRPKPSEAVTSRHSGSDLRRLRGFQLGYFCLYRRKGKTACRTFITKTARVISRAGGSLRDVQELAGHSRIGTTQGYIEGSSEAQRKAVDLI